MEQHHATRKYPVPPTCRIALLALVIGMTLGSFYSNGSSRIATEATSLAKQQVMAQYRKDISALDASLAEQRAENANLEASLAEQRAQKVETQVSSKQTCVATTSDLGSLSDGVIISHKAELYQHSLPQGSRDSLKRKDFLQSTKYAEMHSFLMRKHPDLEDVTSAFARDGFIVFKPDISADVLDGAASFTQSIIDICVRKTTSIPAGTKRHCGTSIPGNYHQDRYDEVEVVKQLADNYHIHAMLSVLHGAEPYPFQTLNYPQTSLARTHSDWIHFASEPSHLMGAAWCALEDVNPDAGPVFYVPGSHHFPVYTMQDFGLEPRENHKLNYAKYQDVMEAVVNATKSKVYHAVLKKGECLIWSSNLIHGGPPANKPELSRLSQVTHYFFKGSSYNWAPVMSDVNKDQVVYYVQDQIEAKWRRRGESFKETVGLSKFRTGTCSEVHPSPCAKLERMPEVMSTLLQHNVATGESVM